MGRRHDRASAGPRFAAVLALIGVFVLAALAPAAGAERPLRLVALGDSLTAGYRLPAEAAFPAVLERALKDKGLAVSVANAGVSGDTSTGGRDRAAWSVPDGTDGVILELGANDMLRGTDPAVTRRALEAIVTEMKGRGIPVMLAGMRAAANLGPDYVTRFDAIYPDLAAKHGLILYPFFLAGVAGEKGLNLDDGLHPNARGVERIVSGILPDVERFVGRIQADGSGGAKPAPGKAE